MSRTKMIDVGKEPLMLGGAHLSCEHGLKVYLVDGTRVRNNLDSDFVSGSGRVFRFIPKSEIWIDASIPKEEVHFLIENECVLAEEVRNGASIEKACAKAQRAEKTSRKAEKVTAPKRWKVSTGEHCEHGLEIFIVDGTYVRDKWDSQFIQGGHKLRYDFVPEGEIWIEASLHYDERPYVIFHECLEIVLMKKGLDYDQAHDKAKRAENKLRRRDRPGE
jgi:hypothetical protein